MRRSGVPICRGAPARAPRPTTGLIAHWAGIIPRVFIWRILVRLREPKVHREGGRKAGVDVRLHILTIVSSSVPLPSVVEMLLLLLLRGSHVWVAPATTAAHVRVIWRTLCYR